MTTRLVTERYLVPRHAPPNPDRRASRIHKNTP
jgi:hypothetical protein